jgi:hypothetical protein
MLLIFLLIVRLARCFFSLFRITLLTGEEADTIIVTERDADQENYQAGGALHTLVNGDGSDK